MTHIRYDAYGANIEGQIQHPQKVLKSLDIDYKIAMPVTAADCWFFFCCSNLPESMPSFITKLEDASRFFNGYGLTPEDIETINSHDQDLI